MAERDRLDAGIGDALALTHAGDAAGEAEARQALALLKAAYA